VLITEPISSTLTVPREETPNMVPTGHQRPRLRSHGGLGEQQVPFILSQPFTPEYRQLAETRLLRNFNIFDFVLNVVE